MTLDHVKKLTAHATATSPQKDERTRVPEPQVPWPSLSLGDVNSECSQTEEISKHWGKPSGEAAMRSWKTASYKQKWDF